MEQIVSMAQEFSQVSYEMSVMTVQTMQDGNGKQ